MPATGVLSSWLEFVGGEGRAHAREPAHRPRRQANHEKRHDGGEHDDDAEHNQTRRAEPLRERVDLRDGRRRAQRCRLPLVVSRNRHVEVLDPFRLGDAPVPSDLPIERRHDLGTLRMALHIDRVVLAVGEHLSVIAHDRDAQRVG